MAEQVTKPDEFATVIGPDAQFKGELSFQGGVRIDGQFEGSITTAGKVFASKSGRLKAEVRAGSLAVEGTIDGNVVAEDRCELRASCTLRGDLKAAKLLVVEGATFVGRCEVGPAASQAAPPKPTAADVAAMAQSPSAVRRH
jgi:cytoskeletal protein CcmA (bactofilin family)